MNVIYMRSEHGSNGRKTAGQSRKSGTGSGNLSSADDLEGT
jgi:hypothetical protein